MATNRDRDQLIGRKRAANGMTYADWLTKAIESSANQRLTLAEIYDWMVLNVPGLSGQRYLHSSKGWKNAVRHTLSVNVRFSKVARSGLPSFWSLSEMKPHGEHSQQQQQQQQRQTSGQQRAKRARLSEEKPCQPCPTVERRPSTPVVDVDQSGLTFEQYWALVTSPNSKFCFRPKPSLNFRTSPTSAFMRCQPRSEAMA